MCVWYNTCKKEASTLPNEKISKYEELILSGKGMASVEAELQISNEQSLGIIALSLRNEKNTERVC